MILVLHMRDGKEIISKIEASSDCEAREIFDKKILPTLANDENILFIINDSSFGNSHNKKYVFIRDISWFELRESYTPLGLSAMNIPEGAPVRTFI